MQFSSVADTERGSDPATLEAGLLLSMSPCGVLLPLSCWFVWSNSLLLAASLFVCVFCLLFKCHVPKKLPHGDSLLLLLSGFK